ncbi:hypothetical protein BDV18DRAFT_128147 [Aspergillus unguis]
MVSSSIDCLSGLRFLFIVLGCTIHIVWMGIASGFSVLAPPSGRQSGCQCRTEIGFRH